jgi:hypothetical protein
LPRTINLIFSRSFIEYLLETFIMSRDSGLV